MAWETALAVTTSGPRAARTAVGERMAGGADGSWPTFTPPTALTAGETRVALLDYMNENTVGSQNLAVRVHFETTFKGQFWSIKTGVLFC